MRTMEYSTDVEIRTTEHSIPFDVLSDLISRFIINVPDTAKQNLIRICFQVELAYWYYLDFYVNSANGKLRSCGFRQFAAHVFSHLPSLRRDYDRLDEVLDEWREYKQSVPTYGAILLCEGSTHVLLVQSYCAKNSWGFPKGKVNEDEDPAKCAIREVLEETGFDISDRIDPEHYLEAVINEQLVRLYVVAGIPRATRFRPRTRYEIKACEWFAIADLPNNKKDETPRIKMGVSPHSFYMVLPFVKRIKRLVAAPRAPGTCARRQKSSSFSESSSSNANSGLGTTGPQRPKYKRCDSESKERKKEISERPERTERSERPERSEKTSKRQLFNDEEVVFTAPSWLNFKFDMAAILKSIP